MSTHRNPSARSKRLEPKIVHIGCPEEFHIGSKVVHLTNAQEGIVTRVIRSGPDTIVDYILQDDGSLEYRMYMGHGWPEPVLGILIEPGVKLP